MIALTQEKREELIERYSQQIITFKYHLSQIGQEHFDGKAYAEILLKTEIALAALTAKSVLHAVNSDVEDKIYTALCNENEDGAYPLFTAPPVPEIKLPEKLNAGEIHYELTEKYGLDVSIDQLERGLAEEVYSIAVNTFERLNGLGE
ncbi:hypothetical protein [Rosenbergiella epipactidis]|uniref:hypothetical protein n=1 Tax=Rosenbergiella epipactidis TaxID=1544694 RepID=UPI001F4EBE52|nr:hypothetical protein [Rosenbergiella epipactidis]